MHGSGYGRCRDRVWQGGRAGARRAEGRTRRRSAESSELLSEEERVSWSETAGLWPEDVRAAYRLPTEALPKLLADCSGIYAFTLSAPVKEAAECIILLAAED